MKTDKTLLEKAVSYMSDYVNNYECRPKEFAELFGREHQTLQQSFTRVCLAWLEHLAEMEEDWYDLRNEASVHLARKIVEKFKNDMYLPFIQEII